MLLLAVVLAEPAGEFLTRRLRIFLVICFVCIFLGTFGIFFLIYHTSGGGMIGVQGRYFIIAVPLLLIALLPKHSVKIPLAWFQGAAIVMALVCTSALTLAYHLPCGEGYYTPGACFLPKYKNWSPSTSLSFELSKDTTVTQFFYAECDNLNQIRIWIADKGRGGITFLLENEDSDRASIIREIPNVDLPQSGWYTIHFPDTVDSSLHTFEFTLTSSTGEEGQPVRLAYFDRNEYLNGDLSLDGNLIENDLLFQYGCSVGLDRLLNLGSR